MDLIGGRMGGEGSFVGFVFSLAGGDASLPRAALSFFAALGLNMVLFNPTISDFYEKGHKWKIVVSIGLEYQ